MTKPPPLDYPYRDIAIDEALTPAYDALVLQLRRHGWKTEDIALGLERLAQAHIASLNANSGTVDHITLARLEADTDPFPHGAKIGDRPVTGEPVIIVQSATAWAVAGAAMTIAAVLAILLATS